jgi:hypothetical protein
VARPAGFEPTTPWFVGDLVQIDVFKNQRLAPLAIATSSLSQSQTRHTQHERVTDAVPCMSTSDPQQPLRWGKIVAVMGCGRRIGNSFAPRRRNRAVLARFASPSGAAGHYRSSSRLEGRNANGVMANKGLRCRWVEPGARSPAPPRPRPAPRGGRSFRYVRVPE